MFLFAFFLLFTLPLPLPSRLFFLSSLLFFFSQMRVLHYLCVLCTSAGAITQYTVYVLCMHAWIVEWTGMAENLECARIMCYYTPKNVAPHPEKSVQHHTRTHFALQTATVYPFSRLMAWFFGHSIAYLLMYTFSSCSSIRQLASAKKSSNRHSILCTCLFEFWNM